MSLEINGTFYILSQIFWNDLQWQTWPVGTGVFSVVIKKGHYGDTLQAEDL